MNHMGTIRIGTSRLILRRFTIEDADMMYRNWASNDEVTKYLTWPTHTSPDVTRGVLEEWISRYNEPNFYNWGIELKDSGELVGNISVVETDDEKSSALLGWCMGTYWWGQEIMPEAASAVLHYLFSEVGYNRISSNHDEENSKSGRVMQKIGMTYEGTLRASGKNNRGIIDEVWYSILKEEYQKDHAERIHMTWRKE